MALEMPQIQDLTDQDLRSELSKFDIKAGPLGRNRKLYENRLFKAIHGHDFGKKPAAGSSKKSSSTSIKNSNKTVSTPIPTPIAVAAVATPETSKNKKLKEKFVPSQIETPKIPSVVPTHHINKSLNYDSYTNLQIREKIKQHGQTCGPITTPTIKKLMVKKLEKLDKESFSQNLQKNGVDGINNQAEKDKEFLKKYEADKEYSTAEDSTSDEQFVDHRRVITNGKTKPATVQNTSEDVEMVDANQVETSKTPNTCRTRNIMRTDVPLNKTFSPIAATSANFSSEDDSCDDPMGVSPTGHQSNSKNNNNNDHNPLEISPIPSGLGQSSSRLLNFSTRTANEISIQTSQIIGINDNDFSTNDEDEIEILQDTKNSSKVINGTGHYDILKRQKDKSSKDIDGKKSRSASRSSKSKLKSFLEKENKDDHNLYQQPSFTCEQISPKEPDYLDKKRQLARRSAGVCNKSISEILKPRKSLISGNQAFNQDKSDFGKDSDFQFPSLEISSTCSEMESTSEMRTEMVLDDSTREQSVVENGNTNTNSSLNQPSEPKKDEKPSIFYNFVNFLPKIFLASVLVVILSGVLAVNRSSTSFFSNDSSGLGSATDANFALDCKSDDGLCLSSQDLDFETKSLLHKFYNQLNQVSALHNCGETLQDPNLKIIDVLELVGMDEKFHVDHKVVKNVVKEFFIHPKYGVQIFDGEGRMLEEDFELGRAVSLLVRSPVIDHPKCKYHKMREEIYSFFKETVFSERNKIIFMTAIVILITYKLVRFKIKKSNDRKKSIQNYVDLIIDTVENLSMTANRERPINHIRDQLISINDRASLAATWEEAVEFVRSNESRIAFTEKEIDGNFMEVVSWADSSSFRENGKSLSFQNVAFSEKWKGAACVKETLEKCPQGCVAFKIRDFFDRINEINTKPKQEQLLHEIMGQVNLVLAAKKKGQKNNFVEKSSLSASASDSAIVSESRIWPVHYGFEENAAYLRFSCEDEALKFYNAINAQWYNKKLLTPKFVQDSKYYKRFPGARKSIYRK